MSATPDAGRAWLGVPLLLYVAATFVHFAHNAAYLAEYPNLPAWLSRSDIYGVWIGQAAIGLGGYVIYRKGSWVAGLALVGLYAVLGFDGLLHYTRAPMAAHTAAMNFTIWLEVVAAGLLLFAVSVRALEQRGAGPATKEAR